MPFGQHVVFQPYPQVAGNADARVMVPIEEMYPWKRIWEFMTGKDPKCRAFNAGKDFEDWKAYCERNRDSLGIPPDEEITR